MRVETSEYRLTDEEAREEAAARLAVLSGKAPGQTPASRFRPLFGWILFLTLAASVYLLMKLSNPGPSVVGAPKITTQKLVPPASSTADSEFRMSVNFWGLLSCSSAMPLFLMVVVIAMRPTAVRGTVPFETPPPRDRWHKRLILAVASLAAALAVAAVTLLDARADWTIGSGRFIQVQVAPWMVLLSAFAFRAQWIKAPRLDGARGREQPGAAAAPVCLLRRRRGTHLR
ncbi:MAG: hypothetical protein ACHRHE_01520 [Tepidisphaerales bacterium]